MSGERDAILARIRRSLRRAGPLDGSIAAALEARTRAHHVHAQPQVAGDLAARFASKLEAAGGEVTRVPALADVPDAVRDHREAYGLPAQVVMSDEPLLREIPWPPDLRVERRAARGEDALSITGAFAAVAETGTVVLVAAPESPTTLSFLAEDHIVVLQRGRIVRHLEDVWARLREATTGMPRTVNFISGPSKTADVEQTLQTGAHGPRRLRAVLVENGEPASS